MESLEERLHPSVAPTLPLISPNPDTVTHGTTPTAISLNAVDNDPGTTLSYQVSFLDPLLAIQKQYGLNTPDIASAFNLRGQQEKYLLSSNGSNASHGGYYLLMPSGDLYAWNGVSVQSSILQTPAAAMSAAVYQNPLLLTSTTGIPLVSGTNPLYQLKMAFGLVTSEITSAFNQFGGNEKWLHSSNGSNAANGGYYMLLPNDTLVAWNGTRTASGDLAANLGDYGNVYADPSLLTNAALPTSVGIAALVNPAGGGSLTLTPTPGFDRAVQVTVTVSDGLLSTSQSFTFSVTDTPPGMSTPVNQSTAHNAPLPAVSLNASDAESDPLTYSTDVTGDNTLYNVKLQYGLNTSDIAGAFNLRGEAEKYFRSSNGSNAANNGYYVLMPTNLLYAWDGNSLTTTTAQSPVANLSAYGVYASTALLYNAQIAPIPTVFSNQGILYDVREQYGLSSPDLASSFNLHGGYERYFVSGNGSNAAHGGLYVLLPNGLLYVWNGVSLASTVAQTPVADLSSEGVYGHTALLYQAQPVTINDPVYEIKETYGLYTADFGFNFRGQNEKYFKSGNGSNAAHGGYYVLMPSGMLYAWDGVSLSTTTAQSPVANLSSAGVYANTALLYSDTGETLAVAASIDGSGNITINQNPAYRGTAAISAAASDGAEITGTSFLFTSTDVAPTVANLSPISVNHGVTIPSVNAGAMDAENDPLSYSVQVSGYNALYDLQTQFGLTQPDLAGAFNIRGGNEKYLQSTNGSNAANGGFYVLMPSDKLYAYIADSNNDLASTLSGTPIADFNSAAFSSYGSVYASPRLLFAAQPPAAPLTQLNRGAIYDIREQFGLTNPDIPGAFNLRGGYEKYFQSANGSNAGNGGYYVLMPNNMLYAWDGNSLASTVSAPPLANLSAYGVYANTALLYKALPAFIGDPLFAVKDQYGLSNPDIAADYNYRGQGEKYFVSTNGSNAAHDGFYVLMPSNLLYAWDGVSLSTTTAQTPIANFASQNVYANTPLLYQSTGLAPSVTASVDSSGNVTLAANAGFAGTLRVTVSASDGLLVGSQNFLLTVQDGVPVLAPITSSNIVISGNTATVTLNPTDSFGNSNDLSFNAVIATDSPIFNVKTQYGLTQADIAADYNLHGGFEKYFSSTNGSNAVHGGLYVLLPNNRLYAWDGVSLATTTAVPPLADLTYYGAYANTALLYAAAQPAAPSTITKSFTVGSPTTRLTLTWPAGYAGAFLTTVSVGDGAEEAQQSFVLPGNSPTSTHTLGDQTVSAGSSPTQIDLAGYFGDTNVTNSEVTYNISNNGVSQQLNVNLFDTTAPQTVANFLDYVRSGSYNNSIFTRLVSGFVLQGGGLALNAAGNELNLVPLQPAIPNEFGASNTANTLAMALSGGNPNSATDQYYFNLANNSGLDPQKFTVFGQLADNSSQSTLASLATTGVHNESGTPVARAYPSVDLSDVPLNNYSGANFPTDAKAGNYMLINSIVVDRQTEFLTYYATSSNPSLVTASTGNEWLKLSYQPHQTGTATITVTATDLYGFTLTEQFKVTVNPSPPVTSAVKISLNSLTNTTSLTAIPTTTDPQGLSDTYSYQWLKNSVPISGATSATLSLVGLGLAVNDQLTVQVTPSDSLLTGAMFTSNPIPIATVAPITIQGPTISGIEIAPSSSTNTVYLTAEPSANADPLGGQLTGTFQWYKNGVAIQGATANTLLLTSLNLQANDKITVKVIASDGTLTGPAYTSNALVVSTAGSTPTFQTPSVQVSISADNPSNTKILTGVVTTQDPVGIGIQWFKNGVAIPGANNFTLDLSTISLNANDVITLEADGVEGPLVSPIVTSNGIKITSVGPPITTAAA